MKPPTSRRPSPARFPALLSLPCPPPSRATRKGGPTLSRLLFLLLLWLLLPSRSGTPALAADLFVKVDNPGWSLSGLSAARLAWGDYDGDGWVDLFVSLRPDWGPVTTPNQLYRNSGNGTFTRMTAAEAGVIVDDPDIRNECTGYCLWADVNNDGLLDLLLVPGTNPFVTARLYLNRGNGFFASVDAGSLTRTYRPFAPNGGSLGDYDNDGWLDVFLPNVDDMLSRFNLVFHGLGEGRFERVTDVPFATGNSYASSWVDLDADGDSDLLVYTANTGPDFRFPSNRLFRNEGHGRFTHMTNSVLAVPFEFGAWSDFDNDGDLDSLSLPWWGIQMNDGAGGFDKSQPRFDAITGGGAWIDYDNDGHLDVYIVGGGPWRTHLYRNNGSGLFLPVEDAFTRPSDPYDSLAWCDYDNDGFVDVLAWLDNIPPTPPTLFRNQGNGNHWIKFILQGTAANRSAVRATVRVRATIGGKTFWQMRVVDANGPGDDPRPHFGLGDATMAEEVRVEWPSGNVTVLTNLAANRILPITEVVNIEPARPVAVLGGSVTFTHALAATSRQWYSEAGMLAGETNAQLTLPSVQLAQAGRYRVVAQTDTDSQTNCVYLRVLSPSLAATHVAEGLRLECRGAPSTTYTLQSSGFLTRSWIKQGTVTTDADGVAAATVPLSYTVRFFRAVKE